MNNRIKINLLRKRSRNFGSWGLALLSLLIFNSCEDKIDLELEQDGAQLVVDAWVNNMSETQVIKLRRTAPYFESAFAPEVLGATVTVFEGNLADSMITGVFQFEDADEDGNYTWTPAAGESLAKEGKDYALVIELNGDEYISLSTANRPAQVDSIGYEFRESIVGQPEGIYATFFAIDQAGEGDVYWIKSYKNGAFLNKPQELNIAYDGGFSPGGGSDGGLFLPPIREAINRIPDFEDDAPDDLDIPPWTVGDTAMVEVHSITLEAFYYLFQAREQMTQGDNGLFATPITNVPTNIFSQNENAKEEPVGFFCVSMVGTAERVIE